MISNNILKVLGETIKQRRTTLKISQEKYAELCNVHRTYISQIERGLKNVSVKVLFSLAENLNTTPSELIKEVEQQLESKKE
ncbi:helix-turn-helix domain-containing protein [Bacillus haynesii]|uniref:helix-turn-helix domain-containing protein n=1 Tax=Bacillus haynesii TaxID=1925021 RepID=UPI00227E4F75|nr:helix-turn-helix transcriptional regulator [Bacillus haynesii]MCY7912992.1 helix-turn-helix domain-containing protein [Bacillus haynesii]MCY7927199.1 helix-turn-helix domain-containing protein [Bacillus haynesii]MCY8758337.1 helix-turn-helix domain-containing protein [Bacillus haynesii]MCY8771900.1 helix-turn-helix domain-containing protein [Bacillus haynesii]MEC0789372.1 helix-turn-helix transcriptional regulator [Bacillus haynesii]